MTKDISPAELLKAYQVLNWKPTGKTAVKLSTGEPPNSNYLRPELIQDLVQWVNGTIVECNTAYGGSRASSAMHRQVAADHGFTAIADFALMDEEGRKEIPVTDGERLNWAIVGSYIDRYDNFWFSHISKATLWRDLAEQLRMSPSECHQRVGKC